MDPVVLHTIEGTDAAITQLNECIQCIDTLCNNEEEISEPAFVAKSKNLMEEATTLSREIASFLDIQRHSTTNKEKLKATKHSFVDIMKQFQQTQRKYARKREILIEYDLIQQSNISSDDLKRAKEEEEKITKLAEETGELQQVFQVVRQVVGEQTSTIEMIDGNARELKIQIGQAISEEEQAAYLREQKMKKKCLVLLLLLFILAAVLTPVILHYTK